MQIVSVTFCLYRKKRKEVNTINFISKKRKKNRVIEETNEIILNHPPRSIHLSTIIHILYYSFYMKRTYCICHKRWGMGETETQTKQYYKKELTQKSPQLVHIILTNLMNINLH